MTPEYEDIRSRIAEEPSWFDEGGVPRYGEFHPRMAPNIYADEVVLYEIGCQGCDRRWRVCTTRGMLQRARALAMGHEPLLLADEVTRKLLHYGDPPSHVEDDHAGSTMNSIPIRVIEFWRRVRGWQRVPDLEVSLSDDEGASE